MLCIIIFQHITLFFLGKAVTSEDFDIRIMIHLLGMLANYEFGDLYPVQSDERISAMLSRIKYIRNEVTQNYEGKLSEDMFNRYLDDITQVRQEKRTKTNKGFVRYVPVFILYLLYELLLTTSGSFENWSMMSKYKILTL